MIKAVIFDVGGVLKRTVNRNGRRAWENRLELNEWESEEIVFNSNMGTKAQLGEISEEALWLWVGERLNLSQPELDRFRHDFWADDEVDEELVDFIKSLRPNYQTAIISNASDSLRSDLTEKYEIAQAFDLIVCSAEEKVMKPDREIFQKALERLGREANECVFVDDMEINVAAAKSMGFRTIQAIPDLDIPAELERVGVIRGGAR